MKTPWDAALDHYNWLMMQRPIPPPRYLHPWHPLRVHENDCRCPRCLHLRVNGAAEGLAVTT